MDPETQDPDTELTTPPGDENAVEGQPQGEAAGASTDESIELPFRLEDIEDEDQRKFLQGRQAQIQSAYDKKYNQLRSSTQELADLQARLSDPDQQEAAALELLDKYGLELVSDEEGFQEPATPTTELQGGLDEAAVARLERLEQADAARTEEAQRGKFMEHIQAGLTEFASGEGYGVDEMPGPVREQILANALALPRTDNGLLAMSEAITQFEAQRAFHMESARKGYLKSKDTPIVDLSGEAGDPQVNLSSKQERLKAADAIAGRHV